MKIKKLQFKEKYGPFALVAGGSYGLGGAYSEALAKRGLNLVIIARNKEKLEETAARLREQYGVEIKTLAQDLADFEKTKNLITELEVSIGLLVYNAAFAPIELIENASEENLSQAMMVNVRTPILLANMLCPSMVQNKRGGIVLMSSLAGGQGCPRLAPYTASKAFNAILAEGLWAEMHRHGVDVVGCCPGGILTPGYQQAGKDSKYAPGTMSPGDVAEQTIRALGKGPIVIPGGVNKLARFLFTRLLTRKRAISIMSKTTGGLA